MLISRTPVAIVVTSLVATAAPLAAANPDPAQISQEMLDALVDISGVPGFGAAVWSGDQIVWTGSAGERDLERGLPVDANTRFRLASVSKLLAVTAAAKLAEDGRLDLDAPVNSVLPWLKNEWSPISLRQLAAHASGLPHYQQIDAGRGKVHYPTGRDAVGIFSDRELLAMPGSAYQYSSWGYTLIGAVIEEVSDQHFTKFLSSRITHGLNISADATDSAEADVSVAYEFANGTAIKAPPHDFSYTWAGGGMMASAQDLVAFGGRMLENKVVSKQTFDAMIAPFRLTTGELAGDDGYTVGFGWRASSDSDGNPIAFHNGSAIGARSSLVLWREERTAAAILSNASWISSIDLTAQMLAAPFRAAHSERVDAPCPVKATRYEGRFGDIPVAGRASFKVSDGLCRGELSMTGELADYFARGPQKGPHRLALIGVDDQAGLSRAGLVTPFGIYDFRALEASRFESVISTSRTLEMTFLD